MTAVAKKCWCLHHDVEACVFVWSIDALSCAKSHMNRVESCVFEIRFADLMPCFASVCVCVCVYVCVYECICGGDDDFVVVFVFVVVQFVHVLMTLELVSVTW
jgi:hypothetical protein